MKKATVLALAATLSVIGARAEVINVQFGCNPTATPSCKMTGDAYVSSGGGQWNSLETLSATSPTLVDGLNHATSVTLTGTQDSFHTGVTDFAGTDYAKLMASCIFDRTSSADAKTFTIGNLDANRYYRLTIYAQGDIYSDGRFGTVTATGGTGGSPLQSITTNPETAASTFILNQNVIDFTVNTGSTGTIAVSYTAMNGTNALDNFEINGFQLSPTGTGKHPVGDFRVTGRVWSAVVETTSNAGHD